MRASTAPALLLALALTGLPARAAEEPPGTAGKPYREVIQRTYDAIGPRLDQALSGKTRVEPLPDQRSYYLLWYPARLDPRGIRRLIVSLHDQEGWAADEIERWRPWAEKYGFGILAPQWRHGEGFSGRDFYAPDELYYQLQEVMAADRTPKRGAILHGQGRGSAVSYAISVLDQQRGRGHFALSIANAGAIAENYPLNQRIAMGVFGGTPFGGTFWVMYCGENDPNPLRDGCPAMSQTRLWLEKKGANIIAFLSDTGDHHGFSSSAAHVERAIAAYDEALNLIEQADQRAALQPLPPRDATTLHGIP